MPLQDDLRAFDAHPPADTAQEGCHAPSVKGARKKRPRAGALRCGGLVRPVRATLTLTIKGQWTLWKKGTAVWAYKTGRGEYFMRRVRSVSPARLSCQNEMAGVPRYLLKIKRPNVQSEPRPDDALTQSQPAKGNQ